MIHMATRYIPGPPPDMSSDGRDTGRAALLFALLLIVLSVVAACFFRPAAASPWPTGEAANISGASLNAPAQALDPQNAFRSDSTIIVQMRSLKKSNPYCRPNQPHAQPVMPPICLSGILAGLFAHACIHGKDSDSVHLQLVLKNTFMVRAGPGQRRLPAYTITA